jgi:monofunctional biosynthetic peptidoglycan transglycosylase
VSVTGEPTPPAEPEPAADSPPPDVAPPPEGATPAPRKRRLGRGCLIALLAPLALAVLFAGYEAITWPRVGKLARENPKTTSFIERYKHRNPGANVGWRWASYGAISPHLKRAVIVAEDINFFAHHGFDAEEIRKAIEEAWEEREAPRGASTITQQLAKNLWLSPSRNPLRKAKELLLTRELEKNLSKRRILELYLNVVEFGPGVYGAEAAARHYFGKSARDLGEDEAAQLAAGLSRPSRWHPGSTSRAYARHVGRIEARMEKAGFLWKAIQ